MHLFVLVARSEYFGGLVGSSMLEAERMESELLEAPEGVRRSQEIY